MPVDDGRDIIIVSDLHMSAGYYPGTGDFHPHEDFIYDPAFARFLNNLCDRALKENRRWRLVILGDLFDFLNPTLTAGHTYKGRLDRSAEATLAKLEQIAASHPEVFAATGRFVAAGFPLEIVSGNHDIELLRGSAQERFKELVVRYSGRSEAAIGIKFHPWIYYVPGVLYAEHGHQYHDINWFATLLRPYQTENPDEIEWSLAPRIGEYLVSLVESLDPLADPVEAPSRYLRRAVRGRPAMVVRTWRQHARLFSVIFTHMVHVWGAEQASRRARYHEEALPLYASELGLSYDTIVAIDQLAAESARSIGRRLLRKFVLGPVLRALPSVAALLAMYTALRKVSSTASSLALFAISGLGLVRRERRLAPPTIRSSAYLRHVPAAIHWLLQTEDKSVPYYVFGHTHIAEQFPLFLGAAAPHYLNSGTWTHLVAAASGSTDRRSALPFVQITRAPETGAPIGRLLCWNDATCRHEPLS